MNLALWLHQTAACTPDAPALFLGQEQVADYAGFAMQARAVAGWLQAQGVNPGDRVAIYLKNTPAYLSLLFGIWTAGAAAVPINAKLHPREAGFILENAEAKVAFVPADIAADLRGAHPGIRMEEDTALSPILDTLGGPVEPVERQPDDLAWLFYTSGTTGQPKGVMITHGMLLSMALCYSTDVDQVRPQDAALYAAPLSHGAGLYSIMHVRAGARHVCPTSGGFDAAEVLDLAAHFGETHMFAAPTMVKRLTQVAKSADRRGTGLRTVVYAGGPMYLADIIEAADWFGPVFVQIYGQGECPMGITALSRADVTDRDHPDWRSRLASVGCAQSAIQIRIGDANGAPLQPGETGEIMVRGPTVMPGYWQNPQATAKILRDGWLMTGDMGSMDAAGYLTLTDRSKDVIITGGSNVYPREVEEVLLTHDAVSEVSVVGRPHPDWGEEVVAFIVGEATDAELDHLCNQNIARFKGPKAYIRIDALPKNNYGKVLKTDLRKLLKPR